MKAESYYDAIDKAATYAGCGCDQWSTRFLNGLALNGLRISEVMPCKDDALYPGGLPITAQRPPDFEDVRDWSKNAVIVWN